MIKYVLSSARYKHLQLPKKQKQNKTLSNRSKED